MKGRVHDRIDCVDNSIRRNIAFRIEQSHADSADYKHCIPYRTGAHSNYLSIYMDID